MLTARARQKSHRIRAPVCRGDRRFACRTATREGVRQQYVRIKKERGLVDGCGDVIDLADSSDEERAQRIAGRFDVRCITTDDGASAEMIEFLSDDDDGCADHEAGESEPETIDLSMERAALGWRHPTPPAARGSASRLTTGLTSTNVPRGGLLCEYEKIYIDLAQSSSSDDYESTDSTDESTNDAASESNSEVTVPRALVKRPRAASAAAAPIDKKVVQNKVLIDLSNLEIRKPWRFVYRCLDIPFESNPRTDSCGFLFERWDDFWHEHGRAVWERMYWKPMPTNSEEHRQRRNRQDRAVKAFRRLAEDIYAKFGPKLVALVQARPHSGWWYRSKRPLDLVRLRCQNSRLYALHVSRYRERFPFGVRHVRLHCNSCWCLPEATAPDVLLELPDSMDTDSDVESVGISEVSKDSDVAMSSDSDSP